MKKLKGHKDMIYLHCVYCLFVVCSQPCPQYPLVHIQGEETSTFTNGLGESIDLEITDNQDETIERLVKILDGDRVAAELLATEVHRTVICEHGDIDALPDLVMVLHAFTFSPLFDKKKTAIAHALFFGKLCTQYTHNSQ